MRNFLKLGRPVGLLGPKFDSKVDSILDFISGFASVIIFSARFMEWMVNLVTVYCETHACSHTSPHFYPRTNLSMRPLHYLLQESSRNKLAYYPCKTPKDQPNFLRGEMIERKKCDITAEKQRLLDLGYQLEPEFGNILYMEQGLRNFEWARNFCSS